MAEFDNFLALFDLVQSIGIWVVFFWLYHTEKKSHEETRRQYRSDLREVAGFHSNVQNLNTRNLSQPLSQPAPPVNTPTNS